MESFKSGIMCIMKKVSNNDQGFTLVELLLATMILVIFLTGFVQVFFRSKVLAELTRNKTAAMSEAIGKMEEIRISDFDAIIATYNNKTFTLSQLDANRKGGNGYIYVTAIALGELLEVEIVITWWEKEDLDNNIVRRAIFDRIIGEDVNRNGVLDAGEDVDSNGKMSSMVTLVSLIADRAN